MKTKAELLAMYDYVGEFHEGLACVRNNSKFFHVNPDGVPAYKERYDWAGNFRDGVALVLKDRKQIHIRPDGTKVE